MTAHTPGPWRFRNEPYEDGDPYIIIDAGPNLGRFGNVHPDGFQLTAITSEANARLIAAAPDMLAALRDTLSAVKTLGADGWSEAPHLMRVVSAAIAKAEGKS